MRAPVCVHLCVCTRVALQVAAVFGLVLGVAGLGLLEVPEPMLMSWIGAWGACISRHATGSFAALRSRWCSHAHHCLKRMVSTQRCSFAAGDTGLQEQRMALTHACMHAALHVCVACMHAESVGSGAIPVGSVDAAAASSAVEAVAGSSGGAPAGLSLSSLTESGEFWMLLAAQSMALGTIMVRCAPRPPHMHARAWREGDTPTQALPCSSIGFESLWVVEFLRAV